MKGQLLSVSPVTSAVIVTRLRSFGENCRRFQTSPKSTWSVNRTSLCLCARTPVVGASRIDVREAPGQHSYGQEVELNSKVPDPTL